MKSFLIICIILCTVSSNIAERRVVCYWDSTSVRHFGLDGYFTVSDIDPKICTHIVYTYIRFLQSVIIVPDYSDDTIKSFINLKQENPDVKLLIGVGGADQKAQIPSIIASTENDRGMSAQRVKAFVDKFGFDGVDFDWQYPGQGTGTSNDDKQNYVKILRTWRQTFGSGKIFSVSVAAKQKDIDISYDIVGIIEQVDFINLNSYDMRGKSDDTATGFHSPYRKPIGATGDEAEWNAESIVDNWIANGCPPSKLTLGIATYGRSYTLSDVSQTGIGAPVSGVGKMSSYYSSNNAGIVPYAEICLNSLTNDDWYEKFDEGHFAPYAVYDSNQWVSFDTRKTVLAKIHLANNKQLSGVNYASIDRDDFSNMCGFGNFPLINVGYNGIVKNITDSNPVQPQPEPTTTKAPTTTTTTTSTTTTTPLPAITTLPPTTTTTTTTKPTTTTTRTTTTRTTTTTTKLPDEMTAPVFTGTMTTPTATKSPDDEVRTTTTPRTTTAKKTTVSVTNFPTPPTNLGLVEVSSTVAQTTAAPVTQTTTQSTPTTTTTTKKAKTTTTTHFPTPPVTPQLSINANSLLIDTFVCPEANGNFANPNDCSMIYICSNYVVYRFVCISGQHYSEVTRQCEDVAIAGCRTQ